MTLIIVGTYFLVSVFVAAISGVFLRLRKDHQSLLVRVREERRREVLVNAIRSFDGDSAGEGVRLEEDGGRDEGEREGRRQLQGGELSAASSGLSSSSEVSLLSSLSISRSGGKKKKKHTQKVQPPQSFADVVKSALDGKRSTKRTQEARVHPEAHSRVTHLYDDDDDDDDGSDDRSSAAAAAVYTLRRLSAFTVSVARHRQLDRVTRVVITANMCVMCVYHHGGDAAPSSMPMRLPCAPALLHSYTPLTQDPTLDLYTQSRFDNENSGTNFKY